MGMLPEDSIARLAPIKDCGHPFCRECVRERIVSQIRVTPLSRFVSNVYGGAREEPSGTMSGAGDASRR